jgi:hypothetical protein
LLVDRCTYNKAETTINKLIRFDLHNIDQLTVQNILVEEKETNNEIDKKKLEKKITLKNVNN